MSAPEQTTAVGGLASILALPNDNPKKAIFMALAVCLSCSIVVSAAAVGLRPLSATRPQAQGAHKAGKAQLPAFKQYREADGKFYFKLVAADGRLLLQSTGFDAPREAGQAIARLQKEAGALEALAPRLAPLTDADAAEAAAALQALAAAADT